MANKQKDLSGPSGQADHAWGEQLIRTRHSSQMKLLRKTADDSPSMSRRDKCKHAAMVQQFPWGERGLKSEKMQIQKQNYKKCPLLCRPHCGKTTLQGFSPSAVPSTYMTKTKSMRSTSIQCPYHLSCWSHQGTDTDPICHRARSKVYSWTGHQPMTELTYEATNHVHIYGQLKVTSKPNLHREPTHAWGEHANSDTEKSCPTGI
ncbi:uncharacterized protein LOC121513959 [Cheilinus undulatus]|uniref:uncharacterized protein LOC121513959 n=1 Tax=Cheilinus undulatus TaxID=241271 RepID=UPI001BD471C9|nr:uncharacterized protein LOC121513959 [Cheilinus undulatus]XP_041649933.1 uncharacterized protein LOC121513959 [Cheilinus undulatus]XP_041649934.1 uncharacterized protein LOC121513959 [Cheilinus undulatus]